MKIVFSILFLFCFNFFLSQVICSPTIIPNAIFYPYTSSSPSNSTTSIQYLCGPNTTVYDSISASVSCFTAFVSGNCTLTVVSFGCGQIQQYYLKTNSTLNLKVYVSPVVQVFMEPGAILNDPLNCALVSYCNSIIFPTENCATGILEKIKTIDGLKTWHDSESQIISIITLSPDTELQEVSLINSLGQVVCLKKCHSQTSIQIPTSELIFGAYTVKVRTNAGFYIKKMLVTN
ncbi:MAG TPA: T9SS type A sorting domain-containing protein [Bacteroidia bacterium]|nr:T9SS type A sorting domain-containing protein [Bacteroidia bacterium]